MRFDAEIRDLARELTKPQRHGVPTTLLQGVVTSIEVGSVSVQIQGAGDSVPGWRYLLDGYDPLVGDVVWILDGGPGAKFVVGSTQRSSDRWIDYTPVLTAATTNPTLGSGSVVTGSYCRIRDVCFYKGFIQFGTSGVNAGSGVYRISLPITPAQDAAVLGGSAELYDDTANHDCLPYAYINGSNMEFWYSAAWPAGTATSVKNNAPWTWAASDYMDWSVFYRI